MISNKKREAWFNRLKEVYSVLTKEQLVEILAAITIAETRKQGNK